MRFEIGFIVLPIIKLGNISFSHHILSNRLNNRKLTGVFE